MASQTYANLAQSTIAGSYTAGNTTIAVATGEGALFPATGNFTVALDNPPSFFLLCTSRSTDTLTVSATGQEGTTATNKTAGTTITQVITAGSLNGIRADESQAGVYASLPGSGQYQGDVYRCTDAPYTFWWNGSAWVPFIEGMGATLPPTGSWTWDTQGRSTVVTTYGDIYISFQASGSDDLRTYYRTPPGQPYTVVMAFKAHAFSASSVQCGLGLVLGDGTKYIAFFLEDLTGQSANTRIVVQKWTNRTTPSTSYVTWATSSVNGFFGPLIWFKIIVNSTNITWLFSMDGSNYVQMTQQTTGDFLSTITRVGVGAYVHTSGDLAIMSWSGV